MPLLSRRDFVQSSLMAGAGAMLLQPALKAATQQAPARHAPLRLGVNYVPRKNWWYCWQDWDAQSIADDFEVIRSLGFDHVRIQCLWPLIQPGISFVSERILGHIRSLLDAAQGADLDVEITVLTGWQSGLAFMPAWTSPVAGSRSNIFTDRAVIAGEKLLFGAIAKAVGAHPRFLGFDLGNELTVLLEHGNSVTQSESDAWAAEMFDYVNGAAPGKLHVLGLDHEVWWSDVGFSRQTAATRGQATIIHSSPYFSGALERYGYSGIGTLHLAEYNVEFAYAYHTDLNRPVWVEEVGASPEWVPENYTAEYASQVLHNAADTGVLWGLTWWCSHDIDPAIKGFPRLEYSLGLIDHKNHVKPRGRIIAAAFQELRAGTFSSTARKTALVVPDSGLSPKPNPPDWTYGDAFMKLIARGKKSCIVLKSRSGDEDYLRTRGITELISLADVHKI